MEAKYTAARLGLKGGGDDQNFFFQWILIKVRDLQIKNNNNNPYKSLSKNKDKHQWNLNAHYFIYFKSFLYFRLLIFSLHEFLQKVLYTF